MSATDAQTILYSVFPQGQLRAGHISETQYESEITEGYIGQYSGNPNLPGYGAGDCAKAGPIDTRRTQIAATVSAAGGPSIVAGAIGTGKIGAISAAIATALFAVPFVGPLLAGVWGTINPLAKHAAAVRREQGTLCSVVPAVNANLAAVDADLAAGNISVAQAESELDQIDAQYWQATVAITQKGPNRCNAACDIGNLLDGIVIARKQKYRNNPVYYLKKYWWVGAIGVLALLLIGRR